MRQGALPYLLLLPATLFLCVFFLYPFVLVAWEAITRDGIVTLDNFRTMAGNWKFPETLRNTVLLAAIVVPLQLVLALVMATIVSRMETGRSAVLYIFAIPLGISDLAAGLIWLAIFEQSGFLNTAAHRSRARRPSGDVPGLPEQGGDLRRRRSRRGLARHGDHDGHPRRRHGADPEGIYEAAEVFGASPWKRFVKVTLPLLRPSLQTAIILRVILAFEVFAVVAALGGTNLPVLMGETYNWQFSLQDRNVAAAFAMLILAISIGFTLFFLYALRVPKEARI